LKVTIHQPDFMPWFGFFNKIAKADIWILLDHVENNPRDANLWCRRVQILVNGQPTWLSIPLCRPTNHNVIGVPIRDMTINIKEQSKLLNKYRRTIHMAYTSAPYYSQHAHLVNDYFLNQDTSLINRNMDFIRGVMEILNINTRIITSSSLGVNSKSTQLLVDAIKKVGADTYLCGGGASGYQQDELFYDNEITLEYNRFEYPSYTQLRAIQFVPGLSIIDALFNVPNTEITRWLHGH
jgi:hypothetical protein